MAYKNQKKNKKNTARLKKDKENWRNDRKNNKLFKGEASFEDLEKMMKAQNLI